MDANPSMCRALKVNKDELIGTLLRNWVARDDRVLVQRGFEQLKAGRPRLRTTRQFQTSDRALVTVESIEISHVRDGELLQISGVARDISEEVILEHKLWDAGDEHEQALDFALRTSLGLIKGYVYALGQADDGDLHRRKRYVSVLDEEIGHLGKLIEDSLDIKKLDPADLETKGEFIDASECVRSAVEQLKPEAARRDIELLCHLPEQPVTIYSTTELVRRIVYNLAQNAIQHTLHNGRVQIELQNFDDWIELHVRDHGTGIPEQLLPHIFDRYFRGPTHQGDTPGIGLGLAVTQCFATAMGGKIWVNSTLGKGSEFTVMLPRRYTETDVQSLAAKTEQTVKAATARPAAIGE